MVPTQRSFKWHLTILAMCMAFVAQAQTWQQRVDSDIRVSLDDEAHRLHGDIQLIYHNNSPETLDFVWMHLWPNAYGNGKTAMAKQHYRDGDMFMFYAMSRDMGGIDSLAFTSMGQPLEWSYDDEHIDIAKVMLPKPLPPGEAIEISTPFRVDIPNGSISRLGHVGESYQITQWYPKPAVYDEEGWHPMPYLSQGEFYSEFGTFDVRITLPSNYTVGATGDYVEGSEDNALELARLDRLVEETEAWVEAEGWEDVEDSWGFPASSTQTKTLHLRQNRVHDFAWFADKRFKVLRGEVVLPGNGKKVTTWAMFTPEEAELWQKAPEYLHDATYHYSLWNGDYPYNHVTAVDGTISAGGGMEYPNVTVIGQSGSDFGLETVIVHEVGHNWFYGILGSNERDNAWMDEGINSFNEMRYLLTKYGQQKDLSIMFEGRERLVARLDLGAFQYKWIDELSYLFPARFGADQPIQCHSTDLTAMNYGAIIYKKTAAAFAMLQSHLGTARFDAAMQSYFDTWKYRHPGPADLQASMEASTGEDLSWFFEDWIQTTKRSDLELRKASTRKGLVVRNRGELASSAKVSGLRGDSVVAVLDVPLMQPGSKVSLAHPDVAGVDRWVLDHERVTLDYDRRNNSRQTRLFGGVEPIQLRLLSRLENPEQTQVFWMPALGWNAHNGPMAGLVIHNLMLPPRDFTYQWTPLFSANAKGVDFGGILNLDWRKRDWHVGIRSSQFRAEEALQMRPDVTLGNYDGELLTRTSWEIGRTLNANPVSAWKGQIRVEGTHLFGFVDPALDAVYTLLPNSGGVRLQRRASRLEGRVDQTSLAVPGLRQTGSLILGRVATDGFKSTGVAATTDPPHEVVNPAHVSHVFADVSWHAEYERPRPGRTHRWSLDARASRVSSSVERFTTGQWSNDRNIGVPDFGTAVAGTGAHFDPLADQLLLNRGGGMPGVDGGWTGRQAALDRGGLPLDMVAPTGLWSVRGGFRHGIGLEVFAGAAGAWDDGRDLIGGASLSQDFNAVAGVSVPLGPLEIQVPLWVANPAEGAEPWDGWMFKLDLRALNPLTLARKNLQ